MTLDEAIKKAKLQYPEYFEGADNAVEDLLRSPAISDADTITWYAAGERDTWLRIDKTLNGIELQTFQCSVNALAPAQELPPQWFRHRTLRPNPNEKPNIPLDEDMSRHYWSIAQLAAAGFDAWNRGDRAMHWEVLAIIAQHVPSVMDLVFRANSLPPDDVYTPAYKIGYAMQQINALEALSDDPHGQAMLDPWFRAQQLIRLASSAHLTLSPVFSNPALYALEGENEKSYLFVYPSASNYSAANIWLDQHMQPLLLDYESNGLACTLSDRQWDYLRPYPKSLNAWKQAFHDATKINCVPFESLRSGTLRALSPQETLHATLQWARASNSMSAWNHADNPSALLAFGQWTMDYWLNHDPAYGSLLNGLSAALDPEGPPAQLDALRELLSLRPEFTENDVGPTISSEELSRLV